MAFSPQIPRALVTGAKGFIGRSLVKKLKELGTETIALVRAQSDLLPEARILELSNTRELKELLSPDCTVFHLAAHANVAESVALPWRDFEDNLPPLIQVLEAARTKGARVIFPSTGSVFSPDNPLPLTERSHRRPSSPYGAAKLAGEAYAAAYHKSYGLDARVVRLFSVYGPGMSQFAIHDIYKKIKANPREISLFGDGQQIRDYMHIDDVVDGLIHLSIHGAPGEDYNLASGQPTMIKDLALTIAQAMGYPDIKLNFTGEFLPGEVRQWYADPAKVAALGFAQKIPLAEGLRSTLDWFGS